MKKMIFIVLCILDILLTQHFKDNERIKYDIPQIDLNEYTELDVDSCDLSGTRKGNVIVDIGYGDRNYYALSNENSQITDVYAKNIRLQSEDELSANNSRYCQDEANVYGTEKENYDQGHIIADSLGGVSNAYNITPENSYVNRFGAQAKNEQKMRTALEQGHIVHDFLAHIYYYNSNTMTPYAYKFTYCIDDVIYQSLFLNYSLENN